MIESKVANRYAKSLLGLAQEQAKADAIQADMQLVYNTCQASKDLRMLLSNPTIKTDKKQAILAQVFGDKLNALSASFINIIAKKRREADLMAIAYQYGELYKASKGITTAIITTAVKLDEPAKSQIIALIKKNNISEVELVEKVDPSLIGGFVLRVGDKQFDTSVAKSLKRLSKDFSSNAYISAI